MKMSITVEFLAGTDIETAIKEATCFAEKLGLAYVKFNFNGIGFSVGRNADIKKGISAYYQATEKSYIIIP
jgi:hypothetical protein